MVVRRWLLGVVADACTSVGSVRDLTGVCIQREQQEIMGLLWKIVIGTCSRQLVWPWWQEELLEVQVMYLNSALVVCAVPGDCSALLVINPSPGLKDS